MFLDASQMLLLGFPEEYGETLSSVQSAFILLSSFRTRSPGVVPGQSDLVTNQCVYSSLLTPFIYLLCLFVFDNGFALYDFILF